MASSRHIHPRALAGAERFRKTLPPPEEMAAAIRAGNKTMLSRAITLMESGRPEDRQTADRLLELLLPYTGGAFRVGITGIPGAGKSTFIDSLGERYARAGHRVAVLAVDPTSRQNRGSILGDKTRMQKLGRLENVFVRPSPGGLFGGAVNRHTRESILLCEAAGYDRIIVETIGAGQSDSLIDYLTDTVILLNIPGAGDELQGIKRGIMETADMILINKADGENREAARQAAETLRRALLLSRGSQNAVPVMAISALRGEGLDRVWQQLEEMYNRRRQDGSLAQKRREQDAYWFRHRVDELFRQFYQSHPPLKKLYEDLSMQIRKGKITPHAAGEQFWHAFVGYLNREKDKKD